jgi:ABC-type oligopeptide transport system substrate-binding subunit
VTARPPDPAPARARALAWTLALALAAGGCGGARPGAEPAAHADYFGDVTPPADDSFTFNLGAEPESFDPGLATGQPDGRVCRILFEGLTTDHPAGHGNLPGQAYRWQISPDGLTYTFHLRPGLAWTDGTPVTAHDFVWSWLRVLDPATGSRYAGNLYAIANGRAFHRGEITDRSLVGLSAPDDSTFVVRLEAPTPYFLGFTSFYTFLPVPRHAVERHGDRWTHPGNIVSNGAFSLEHWRQNDHFEFRRNPRYWDAAAVRLERIRAYTVDDLNTSANLYKAGVFDWNPSGYIPSQFIPHVRRFKDFRHGRYQGTYYYSFNVTKHPFDDVWVRRALNLAVDREAIANDLLKGSRDPWGGFTPSGYDGYDNPPGIAYDPVRARDCLARAGYPAGQNFPRISILFNTSEDYRRIAEAVQAMWRRELGIEVELRSMEWASVMQAVSSLQYDVARRSWIGDYPDPYTFLSTMLAGDGNNRTGWSDTRYDALLRRSALELDPARRMALLREAEERLLDEAPVIPVYHYATNEMVKPYVRGIESHPLDVHPLTRVWIDRDWRRRAAPLAGVMP